jgi:hypothetical protein
MKAIVILALAVTLEAGFLLTAAVPAPALARAQAAMKHRVVELARAVRPGAPAASRS